MTERQRGRETERQSDREAERKEKDKNSTPSQEDGQLTRKECAACPTGVFDHSNAAVRGTHSRMTT